MEPGSLPKWDHFESGLKETKIWLKLEKWLGLSGGLAMVTTWVQIPASAYPVSPAEFGRAGKVDQR